MKQMTKTTSYQRLKDKLKAARQEIQRLGEQRKAAGLLMERTQLELVGQMARVKELQASVDGLNVMLKSVNENHQELKRRNCQLETLVQLQR